MLTRCKIISLGFNTIHADSRAHAKFGEIGNGDNEYDAYCITLK